MKQTPARPPRPEVQYLPSIFRQIQSGDIRVPAFQRRFVWTRSQILELLESVYRGYPIGSVLFWRVDTDVLKVERDPSIPFPDLPLSHPINFVLDGMQRLATLYGVFHTPPDNPLFDVLFALDERRFFHRDDRAVRPVDLEVKSLLNPRALLQAQRTLSELSAGDELLDRSVELQSVFQEYLLPTVTIEDRQVDEVVEIFERINSTGTKLSAVDFMRALTWSTDFDLNDGLEQLQLNAAAQGFNIDLETLVKILALMADLPPLSEEMLAMKRMSAAQLHRAVARADKAIARTIEFLHEEFAIHSYDFVPYEGQFLLLAKVLAEVGDQVNVATLARQQIVRWFWATGFSEGLQGRPDHYVARLIESALRGVRGGKVDLRVAAEPSPSDFVTRPFRKGAALSSSLAALFGVSGARSFSTGEVIPPSLYLSEFGSRHFRAVVSREVVQLFSGRDIKSAKTLANIVVVPEAEAEEFEHLGVFALLSRLRANDEDLARKVISSQLMSPSTVESLAENQDTDFLLYRSQDIYTSVIRLLAVSP